MSSDDLLNKPVPQQSKPYNAVLPMPKFGTITGTEFGQVDRQNPHKIAQDMIERFPMIIAMPTEHPAFKVALATLSQNPLANMTPIDWAWHREVLRRARMRDEARRIFNRVDFERYAQELHREQEIRREYDKRAFYFAEAVKNKLEQTWQITRAGEKTAKNQQRMVEHGLAIQDENKRTAFIMLYLKYFAPSRERVRRKTKELMTTDTLTEITAQRAFTMTPFEIVVEQAWRMYPVLQKEEIANLFQQWQAAINSVKLLHSQMSAFKRAINKMFTQIFLYDQENGVFAKRNAEARLYNQRVSNALQLKKKDAATRLTSELSGAHLQELERNRAEFEAFIENLNFNRLVTNIYNDREMAYRNHRAEMESVTPVTYRGVTDWIQRDPLKNKTQYALIQKWVNNVMMLRDQQARNFAEITDAMGENAKEDAEQIRAHSLEGALEFARIMDAQRMRSLREHYSLDQIMKMFAATASAANMLTGYHTNTVPSHEATGTPHAASQPRIVKEILQTAKSPKLTG